jgi:branched-chain amino acid transport system substrate-binding protein
MKKNIILLSSVIFLVFIIGCAPAQQAAKVGGPIKIGGIFPLTGDGAAYGTPIQRATMIAVNEINAQGGINGRPLSIVFEDGKCNPKDAVTAAQKLVSIDKVKVILGGACSGETLGASPITEENKVIILSPSSTSPDITTAGDFVFRTAPSDAFAGKVASEVSINKLKAETAGIISETSDYPQGLRKVFKEEFEKLGGRVVADETFNPDDTDLRTQILKVKNADPDVIYLAPQTVPKGVLLVKQIKEAGVKQQLVTAEVLIGRNVVEENAADLEGLIGIEAAFNEDSPKAAAVLSQYTEDAGEQPPFPFYMSAAYDNVYLIAKAIELHGEDTEKIRDFLYSVKDYDGAIGSLTIDENGDPILDFAVRQVKNGKLVDFE